MFVVIYQTTTEPVEVKQTKDSMVVHGNWKVDTGEQGEVATYDDLGTALDRVIAIRTKGGEACLAVIVE